MGTTTQTTGPTATIGGRTVPALGVVTWAMGGPWTFDGVAAGWGEVDDDESVATLRAAFEGGVRLVDTADAYGCGHAERVVGRAVARRTLLERHRAAVLDRVERTRRELEVIDGKIAAYRRAEAAGDAVRDV